MGGMLSLTAWSPGPRSLHGKGKFSPLQLASVLLDNTLPRYEYPVPEKLSPDDFSIFALNNYFIGGGRTLIFYYSHSFYV